MGVMEKKVKDIGVSKEIVSELMNQFKDFCDLLEQKKIPFIGSLAIPEGEEGLEIQCSVRYNKASPLTAAEVLKDHIVELMRQDSKCNCGHCNPMLNNEENSKGIEVYDC